MQKRTSKIKTFNISIKILWKKNIGSRYTIKEKYNSQKSNDKQNICKKMREKMHVAKYENP